MIIDISKTFSNELISKVLKFVDTLDSAQKEKLFFSYSDQERFNWHYTPIKKYGLALLEMSKNQQVLAFNITKFLLSEMGHITVDKIIELEKILNEWEIIQGEKNNWSRDSGLYYFSIFGKPNNDGNPWGIRLNGHHVLVTINFSSKFISLNFHQSQKAILHKDAPSDIITQNVIHVKKFHIEDGIKFTDLFESQKSLVEELTKHYFRRFKDVFYSEYMESIGNLEKMRFVWAGSLNPKKPHY